VKAGTFNCHVLLINCILYNEGVLDYKFIYIFY